MPKSSEVALELGTPPDSPLRTSEEFEQVPYPTNTSSTEGHWGPPRNLVEEELPLHYMNEDKAARRRVRPNMGVLHESGSRKYEAEYDDEKELYHDKLRPVHIPRIGRSMHRNLPPTNLVSIIHHHLPQ